MFCSVIDSFYLDLYDARLLAQVAELVDALASGASVRMYVGVRVSPWAPFRIFLYCHQTILTAIGPFR